MYVAAVFLPLVGSLVAGMLVFVKHGVRQGIDEKIKNRIDLVSQIFTCGLMLLAALASILVFLGVTINAQSPNIELFSWVESGSLEFSWGLKHDTLSVLMVLMVNVVSTMIHIYSIGYMTADKSIPRFMAYLSLFTFFMLMLVSSNNLVQMFFGWEGVGLASYLLIGFWYDRASANRAAVKAFIVNRIGDFGFALGIFAIFFLFDSVNFDTIFNLASVF